MDNNVNYQNVTDFLSRCSDEILRYIELQTAFAKDVRTYMMEYNVSDKVFAQEFGCTVKEVKILRCGGRDISLKDMAKLRSLYAERMAQKIASIQIPSTK